MKYVNAPIIAAPDTATINGAAIDCSQLYAASFQSVFGDTTAAGTIAIQASNDEYNAFYQRGFVPTNWSPIVGGTSTIVAGVAPMILLANTPYRWIRAVLTITTPGTTTFTVNMFAQSI